MSDPMAPRYFGEHWGAPIITDSEQIPVPDGICGFCFEEFKEGDQGIVYVTGLAQHKECNLRVVTGGINCVSGTCASCGDGSGDHGDPEGMTKRESAIAVWAWVEENGIPGA